MTRRFIAQLIRFAALCSLASVCASPSLAQPKAPIALQTDNLVSPLGLDDTTPHFSWQLVDARHAARQTAYQIQIATKRELLVSGKPETHTDIWDSGKIPSG
jgi:hypothetical protein